MSGPSGQINPDNLNLLLNPTLTNNSPVLSATAAAATDSSDPQQHQNNLLRSKNEENRKVHFINKDSSTGNILSGASGGSASSLKGDKGSILLRDCSEETSHTYYVGDKLFPAVIPSTCSNELKDGDNRLNVSPAPQSSSSSVAAAANSSTNIGNNKNLINLSDNISKQSTRSINHQLTIGSSSNRPLIQFKSLLASNNDDNEIVDVGERELKTFHPIINKKCDTSRKLLEQQQDLSSSEDEHLVDDDGADTENEEYEEYNLEGNQDNRYRTKSPSYLKGLNQHNSFAKRVLNVVSLGLFSSQNKELITGNSKYKLIQSGRRTFRGSYKYSRAKISMAILKKIFNLMIQRSTLALLGAFLIHITLGTVYTLSNINSYLTSYMRLHGSPTATYGGSMWMSSLYAVGQGFSMVLGGYIEKRFSAQLSCFIGCALHSISIMCTSWAINHGTLAVLMTYGFLPGFGCGLAYMTPMSNGFGWFPNRRGLVAGVILAGFGIGTFIFNITQTAFVNPDNLSPPEDANGYFTQIAILDRVPHLFVFIGSIYAAMQLVGCCLLFKPPNNYGVGKGGPDQERPILAEVDLSLKRSIRRREFIVLFLVYGVTTQGVLFVNSMIKEYGQLFIGNDMYLAWTGSMASIANSMGRLAWGLAIDRFSFTQCFTSITIIFGSLMFIMPFEFVLSSKLLYLLCTLGLFGSFSGWMSTYPVHLSRVFGRTNSGMIYGLIFVSQSLGGIVTALGAHYLIDHYNRFVPFFCVVFLEVLGLAIYHLFYPK